MKHYRLYLSFALLLLAGLAACAPSASSPAAVPGEPTAIVVRILDLDTIQRITPTPPPTFTPQPTLPPVSTSPSVIGQTQPEATLLFTPTPACRNAAEFVKNLNIGDNVAFKFGELIAKIWQVRNIGDCIWNESYSLVLVGGEALGAQTQIPLPEVVSPGETVDLRVDMVAPDQVGVYTGSWMFQAPDGTRFGIGTESADPLLVSIQIKTLPPPTPS